MEFNITKYLILYLISSHRIVKFLVNLTRDIIAIIQEFAFQDRKIISVRSLKDYIRIVYKFTQNYTRERALKLDR